MADNISAPATGSIFATDEITNVHHPKTKLTFGPNGTATDVTTTDRLPVQTQTGLATEAKQDAMITAIGNISPGGGGGGDASAANQTAVQANAGADATKAVSVQFITGGKAVAVTGTFFQATQPVSGTVGISGSVAVTGPLTDTQLRATALPVSIGGSVAVTGTFWQATQPVSIAATVAVSGPLTDTQLRATAVPVSGTFYQATQPVSAASLPLPSGAATSAKQDALTTLVGEVQASPTANTLLDRVKALLTGIVLAAGSNIVGKFGIDQTTDGTTNKVNIDASLKSGTATRASVNSGTSSVTILTSNANRKGATIVNSDANALLLDLSAGTAAATRYQVRLTQYQSYEVGSGYTGAITGIWEADGSGVADTVEFT